MWTQTCCVFLCLVMCTIVDIKVSSLSLGVKRLPGYGGEFCLHCCGPKPCCSCCGDVFCYVKTTTTAKPKTTTPDLCLTCCGPPPCCSFCIKPTIPKPILKPILKPPRLCLHCCGAPPCCNYCGLELFRKRKWLVNTTK